MGSMIQRKSICGSRRNDTETEDLELYPGAVILALDEYKGREGKEMTCRWRLATVLARDEERVHLRFLGWSTKFNVWIEYPSKRLRVAKTPVQFSDGDKVLAKDIYMNRHGDQLSKWRRGSVVSFDPNNERVKIHYENWQSKWDTWIDLKSRRVFYLNHGPGTTEIVSTFDQLTVNHKESSVKRQHVSSRRESGPDRKRQHVETKKKKKKKKKTCDACDGDHETDNCPHYNKKGREMAKELMKKRRNGEMMHEIGDDGGHFVLQPAEAQVVRSSEGVFLTKSLSHSQIIIISGTTTGRRFMPIPLHGIRNQW